MDPTLIKSVDLLTILKIEKKELENINYENLIEKNNFNNSLKKIDSLTNEVKKLETELSELKKKNNGFLMLTDTILNEDLVLLDNENLLTHNLNTNNHNITAKDGDIIVL